MIQLLNSTQIPNSLLEALFVANSEFTEREKDMLLYICRKTIGWQKQTDWLTLARISTETGQAKQHCSTILSSLEEKKAIVREKMPRLGWIVSLNKERWGIVTSSVTDSNQLGYSELPVRLRHLTKETKTKETITKPYDAPHRKRIIKSVKWQNKESDDPDLEVIQTDADLLEEGGVREAVNGRSTAFDWPSARERWNKVPHQAIIIRFLEEKGIEPESQAELNGYSYRYKRIATHISAFTEANIDTAFKRASKWEDWSLSTVLKEITK